MRLLAALACCDRVVELLLRRLSSLVALEDLCYTLLFAPVVGSLAEDKVVAGATVAPFY